MPNYADGKIYCIRNRADNDKIVYVGSTTQTLANRMSKHRKAIATHPNMKLYKLFVEVGVEHFHVELITDFPCERKEQLTAEEGKYIRMHETTANGCNMRIEGRTTEQRREDNRDAIRERVKQYRIANHDKIVAADKARHEANREEENARCKAYNAAHREENKANCREYYQKNREALLEQKRTYREENIDVFKAKDKAYFEAHRDERNAFSKAYYEANKVELKEKAKAYREAHQDEIRAKAKARHDANKDAINEKRRELKALKKASLVNGASSSNFS